MRAISATGKWRDQQVDVPENHAVVVRLNLREKFGLLTIARSMLAWTGSSAFML